jgi:hypothetical protein
LIKARCRFKVYSFIPSLSFPFWYIIAYCIHYSQRSLLALWIFHAASFLERVGVAIQITSTPSFSRSSLAFGILCGGLISITACPWFHFPWIPLSISFDTVNFFKLHVIVGRAFAMSSDSCNRSSLCKFSGLPLDAQFCLVRQTLLRSHSSIIWSAFSQIVRARRVALF